jgi:hypothetical protein
MANQIDFVEVEKFASLFKAGEVPKFPQSVADLPENMTQRETIRSQMPELWERLHGGSQNQLPADVLLRMHKGELRSGDEVALRAVGMEAAATSLERQLKDQMMKDFEARAAAEAEAREVAREQARAAAEMSRLESIALSQRQLAAKNRSF